MQNLINVSLLLLIDITHYLSPVHSVAEVFNPEQINSWLWQTMKAIQSTLFVMSKSYKDLLVY